MLRILILPLLFIVHTTYSQTVQQWHVANCLVNKDSMMPLMVLLIFKTKNDKGETLETFAQKKLGSQYVEYFIFDEKVEPDIYKYEDLMKNKKFLKFMSQVRTEFFRNERYRKSFIRIWNNNHLVINEVVCTKKEYEDLLVKTLFKKKLTFTLLMLPLIFREFNIPWNLKKKTPSVSRRLWRVDHLLN